MLASSVPPSGDSNRFLVHWPSASLVQATARPVPYCHTASTGSLAGLASTTSAAGFGTEATYPSIGGSVAGFSPPSTALGDSSAGVNVPWTIHGLRLFCDSWS